MTNKEKERIIRDIESIVSLEEQLENIEKRIYLHDMKDTWNEKDYELDDLYHKLKQIIIKKLEDK